MVSVMDRAQKCTRILQGHFCNHQQDFAAVHKNKQRESVSGGHSEHQQVRESPQHSPGPRREHTVLTGT